MFGFGFLNLLVLTEELTILLSFIAKYTQYYKKSHHMYWRLSIRDITLNAFFIVAAKKSLDPTADL